VFPAGVILSTMILLTIAAISRDALISRLRQQVPLLGNDSQATTSCLSGIVGAVMLALVALTETMAVTMVIGTQQY